MANEYYGAPTTPTSDYLAHYGVKGMKWGVRRAIEKGNTKALARQYKKAAKKLAKLSERTDVELQKSRMQNYKASARGATGVGLGALGTAAGLRLGSNVNSVLARHHTAKQMDATQKYFNAFNDNNGPYTLSSGYYDLAKQHENAARVAKDRAKNLDHLSIDLRPTLIGAGIGGLASGAYYAGKSSAARYRTTKEGHDKAVAQRNAWKNQMAEVFKGTKYEGQYSVPKKNKKRR